MTKQTQNDPNYCKCKHNLKLVKKDTRKTQTVGKLPGNGHKNMENDKKRHKRTTNNRKIT